MMTKPSGDGRGPLRAGRRRPAGDLPVWRSAGGGLAPRLARGPAPDTNLPRRYTGVIDPGASAMRKVFWKCLAVMPLLGLTLWWIHSDAQDAREVSAAPLAAGSAASVAGAAGLSDQGGLGMGSASRLGLTCRR